MTDRARLKRRYRRLLALYPRAFRREHEEEMLVVLLACAHEDRGRPGIVESTNLVVNALRVRLRPAVPRSVPTVFWAVRLMGLTAVLELAAVATSRFSEDAVVGAAQRANPAAQAPHWQAVVQAHITTLTIGAPIAAALWLVLAWANGRGHTWARVGVPALLALNSVSLLAAIGQHAPYYATADFTAGVALWAVTLVATVLVVNPGGNRHYGHAPGAAGPSAPGWPRDMAALN